MMIGRYIYRILRQTSILFNVILGGRSNQTFSARNWQWHKNGCFSLYRAIDTVLGEGHCMECWVNWTLIEEVLNNETNIDWGGDFFPRDASGVYGDKATTTGSEAWNTNKSKSRAKDI